MGLTLTWLSIIVLIPLAGLFLKSFELSPDQFWTIVTSRRTLNALKLSFGLALLAAIVNLVMGMIIVWALVRYRFPGRRLFDAIVDIPFALPTAVAGVALTSLFAQKGWPGAPLAELGIKVAFTPIGIFIAMIFIGIPFVVRTVQPVLIDLDAEIEEAAASLGANRWHTVSKVILPSLIPALLTGFALAFARAVGEYGSVIFIAGNLPNVSEIAPLLIVIRLSEFRYADATAIAVIMLLASFLIILVVNRLQRWAQARIPVHGGPVDVDGNEFCDAGEPAAGLHRHGGPCYFSTGNTRGKRPCAPDRCRQGSAKRAQADPVHHRCARDFLSHDFRRAAAGGGIRLGLFQGHQRLSCRAVRAGGAFGHQADAAGGGNLGHAQSGVRGDRSLGDRKIRFSRQDFPDHADRSAVLGQPGHLWSRLRAAVRCAGLLGHLAAGARHPHPVRGAGHCAGNDLRHLPVRRPLADSLDAGAGHAGGGGGDLAGRIGPADVFPRYPAQYEMGPALWRPAVQCARDGRVWRCVRGVGPYPRRAQHDAAAGRNPL